MNIGDEDISQKISCMRKNCKKTRGKKPKQKRSYQREIFILAFLFNFIKTQFPLGKSLNPILLRAREEIHQGN